MENNLFQRPVTILVGLGFPTEIRTVKETYALLSEWSPSKRSMDHAVALNACRAALAGEIDAETARGTFVAFAQRADLLAPGPAALLQPGKSVRSGALQRASQASTR